MRVLGLGGTLRQNSTSLFALKRALRAAREMGADTGLIDLAELALPIYEPGTPLKEYGPEVRDFIERAAAADAMLWSTAAYHGTLAGVTKNALDFFEFLRHGKPPYLKNKVVGLIATAGGDQAAVNAINAMVHVVHSLRGTSAPLTVPIAHAPKALHPGAGSMDQKWAERLEKLGQLVVEMASPLPHAVAVHSGSTSQATPFQIR